MPDRQIIRLGLILLIAVLVFSVPGVRPSITAAELEQSAAQAKPAFSPYAGEDYPVSIEEAYERLLPFAQMENRQGYVLVERRENDVVCSMNGAAYYVVRLYRTGSVEYEFFRSYAVDTISGEVFDWDYDGKEVNLTPLQM